MTTITTRAVRPLFRKGHHLNTNNKFALVVTNLSTAIRSKFISTSNGDQTATTTLQEEYDHHPSHCPVLQQALPALKARFDQQCEKSLGGKVFPILNRTAEAKLSETWNASTDNTDIKNRSASVLIALYSQQNGTGESIPSMLFTARSPHVPQNPSEISFPGGHQDTGDTSLEDTGKLCLVFIVCGGTCLLVFYFSFCWVT